MRRLHVLRGWFMPSLEKYENAELMKKTKAISDLTVQVAQFLLENNQEAVKTHFKMIENLAYIPPFAFEPTSSINNADNAEKLVNIVDAENAIKEISHYLAFLQSYVHNGHLRGAPHALQAIFHFLSKLLNERN